MASSLANRALRSSLFKLPPEIRSTTLQSRAFSNTPSRKLNLVDVALAPPTALFDAVHWLGIPWYAALPLTSILVRGTFVYYFSMLPSRKNAQRRALLHPLVHAKVDLMLNSKYAKEIDDLRESDDPLPVKSIKMSVAQFKARFNASQETGKAFGAPVWTVRPLINFGTLVAFTEAIRMKCGSREGLLPALLSPFQWVEGKLSGETASNAPEPEMKDPASFLAERLEAARGPTTGTSESQSALGTSRASDILNGQDTTVHLSPLSGPDRSAYFDESLTTEGLAWFTDLTVPDPSLIMPVTLFGTILLTIFLRPVVGAAKPFGKSSSNQGSPEDKPVHPSPVESANYVDSLQTYFSKMGTAQRFSLWFGALFFFASLKMPAAILLYLVPTFGLGWLQGRWLDFKYPLPKPIQKCTRPMPVKVRREWTDVE